MSTEQIASLIALSYAPHTWKFLWAPIVDATLSRKMWYVPSALGICATGALSAEPSSLSILNVVVLISNVAVTFLGSAVESLMAHATLDDEKGRAAGWFQAGNLGGGVAGLWLAQNLATPWMAGAILGVACALCYLALFFVPEPSAELRTENLPRRLADVLRDLWSVARSRS